MNKIDCLTEVLFLCLVKYILRLKKMSERDFPWSWEFSSFKKLTMIHEISRSRCFHRCKKRLLIWEIVLIQEVFHRRESLLNQEIFYSRVKFTHWRNLYRSWRFPCSRIFPCLPCSFHRAINFSHLRNFRSSRSFYIWQALASWEIPTTTNENPSFRMRAVSTLEDEQIVWTDKSSGSWHSDVNLCRTVVD